MEVGSALTTHTKTSQIAAVTMDKRELVDSMANLIRGLTTIWTMCRLEYTREEHRRIKWKSGRIRKSQRLRTMENT